MTRELEAWEFLGDFIPCNDFTIEGRLEAIHRLAEKRAGDRFAVFNLFTPYSDPDKRRAGLIYLIKHHAFQQQTSESSPMGEGFVVRTPLAHELIENANIFGPKITLALLESFVQQAAETTSDPRDLLLAYCSPKKKVLAQFKHHRRKKRR